MLKNVVNNDKYKQVLERCFSQNQDKQKLSTVGIAVSQKHLGLLLISKVSFKEHVYNKIIKCSKIIGLMKKVLNSV